MSQDKNQLILDVKNLVVRYETEDGVVHALNGIDLQLGYRQTIGLVGETGAGKTTAALAILRLVPDPPGVVECDRLMIEGRDILNLPAAKMDDPMSREEKLANFNRLVALQDAISEEKHAAYIGKTVRCLIDGQGDDAEYPFTARTPGNRLVRVKGGTADDVGQFREINIIGANKWSLYGELVEK